MAQKGVALTSATQKLTLRLIFHLTTSVFSLYKHPHYVILEKRDKPRQFFIICL